MTQPVYDDGVEEVPAAAPSAVAAVAGPAAPARHGVPWWKGTLFAFGLLVAFYAIALAVMLVGGSIVHALVPKKKVDVFAALHRMWVVGALLGLSVLWLLPPHPWAKRLLAQEPRERPTTTGDTTGRQETKVVSPIGRHAKRDPTMTSRLRDDATSGVT